MEYVVVRYSAERIVRIDGRAAGKTNATLMVERGHHTFDLEDPQDYDPPNVLKDVQNTTVIHPLEIEDFHPKASSV